MSLAFEMVAYGVLGLIVGSFLNVVILRRGARTIGGRSACLHCGAPLIWYDMVPVASWIILRGRCRSCGTRISVQYPLVEATTAIFFALIAPVISGIPLEGKKDGGRCLDERILHRDAR